MQYVSAALYDYYMAEQPSPTKVTVISKSITEEAGGVYQAKVRIEIKWIRGGSLKAHEVTHQFSLQNGKIDPQSIVYTE